MEGLFGSEFDIDLDQSKNLTKKLVGKLKTEVQKVETDPEKLLKSKKLSIQERLAIITEKVIKTLGKQRQNTVVIRSLDDFSAYIDKAIQVGRIDIDTETNNSTDPATCEMVGLCLYVPGEKQAYIPIKHVNVETGELLPNQLTYADCKTQLQRVLDNKVFVVMHNGKFDYEVIFKTCKIAVPPDWDTIIAIRLIDENKYSEKTTSLKYIYTTEIDPSQAKYDIESLFENIPYIYVDPEIFALYAATDSMMTDKLYLWEKSKFEGAENKRLAWVLNNIEIPIVEVTAKMELRGVAVDLPFGEKLRAKYTKQLEELDIQIQEELNNLNDLILTWKLSDEATAKSRTYVPKKSKMSREKIESSYPLIDENGDRYKEAKPKADQLSDPINLGSPIQLAILFYDILKCAQVSKKSPRGTGEDELIAISEARPDLTICKLIIKRRGLVKLISTYIDTIPSLAQHWPDNRIRFKLNSTGTDTGRYSSGGKWKFLDENNQTVVLNGINIQNIPSHNKEIRLLFRGHEDLGEVQSITQNSETIFKVPEITEIETTNGYKYCKDLTAEDSLVLGNITTTVIDIKLNNKIYELHTTCGGTLKTRTQYRLVGSDYSAQEPRLTAFISQDPQMIQAYEEGKDLYAVIAQAMYNNEYWENLEFYPEGTEIELDGKKIVCGKKTHLHKAGKERRASAKTMLLAATYGMSGKTAGERMGKTGKDAAKEGQKLLDTFFGQFPRVQQEIEASKQFLKEHGYVEDWAGRRRHLPDYFLKPYEIKVLNEENDIKNFNPFLNCENRIVTSVLKDKWERKVDEKVKNSQKYQNKNNDNFEGNDEMANQTYENLAKEALKEGVLIIANTGRRAQAERQCFNARIQGGAASLTKLAMVNIDRDPELNAMDAHLVITVHDEVLVECPAYYAEEVKKRLPQIMIDTAKPYINVPMQCDPYNVSHWYEDEAAVSVREEFKKLEKGNPEKGIMPVPREIAFQAVYANHPELTQQCINDVIINESDLTIGE